MPRQPLGPGQHWGVWPQMARGSLRRWSSRGERLAGLSCSQCASCWSSVSQLARQSFQGEVQGAHVGKAFRGRNRTGPRLVTECTDGSRAVTQYDAQFQRWRMEVVKPPKAPAGKGK